VSLMGMIVLAYVIEFITDKKQVNNVTNMVMGAFNLKPENSLSEQLANDVETLTKATFDTVKKIGETIITDGKKSGDKPEEKK